MLADCTARASLGDETDFIYRPSMRRGALVVFCAVLLSASACSDDHTNNASPRATSDRLWSLAVQTAKSYDAHLVSVEAVQVSEDTARQVVPPRQTSGGGESAVWIMQLRGSAEFTCECNIWPGRTNPPGRYLAVVVDPKSYKLGKAAVLTDKLDLTKFGSVQHPTRP